MLTNFIVVTILQYIHVLNHDTVHLKLTYMSISSQESWGRNTQKNKRKRKNIH